VSPEVIHVNLKKANGPFMIYDCPDFPAKKDVQMRAFYIVLGIDERFIRMDETTTWYSGRVVGKHQVEFRVPAWPFPLYPHAKNTRYNTFWKAFTDAVPTSAKKEMTNVHSIFDLDSEEMPSSAVVEARKWTTFLLDFSKVKGVGELSSQAVFGKAGPTEKLDCDYIDVPFFNEQNKEEGSEAFLGFRVGVHPVDGEGSRKVSRSAATKSALALKKEKAAEAKKNGKTGQAKDDGMDMNDE
jgi:hypothetical protein